MKYMSPLLVVENIAASRKFYEDVLGQKIIMDFGENITFDGSFSLQSKASWAGFIDKGEQEIAFNGMDFELYFEEENLADFLAHLQTIKGIKLVHDVKEHEWGQRVIRFYDLDKHIIEVGESMQTVVKRFLAQGLTAEEASKRTMFPIDFIKSCMD